MYSIKLILTAVLIGLVTITQAFTFDTTSVDATSFAHVVTDGSGYNMTWTGPSKGVNITLFGDAVSILEQLKALDPDWVPANPPLDLEPIKVSEYNQPVYGMYCCPVNDFVPVSWANLQVAINSLNYIGGQCLNGPRSCGLPLNPRSCYKGAGIWFCNDDTTNDVVNCQQLALFASRIYQLCGNHKSTGCGQDFAASGGNWNVVVNKC